MALQITKDKASKHGTKLLGVAAAQITNSAEKFKCNTGLSGLIFRLACVANI